MKKHGFIFKNRFIALLFTLVLFLVLPTFIHIGIIKALVLSIVLSLLFIQSLYIVIISRRHLLTGMISGIIILALIWLSFFFNYGTFAVILADALLIIFFTYIIRVLVHFLLKSKEVTADFIFISVNIYLLLGIIGAFIFSLLNELYPSGFSVPQDMMNELIDFLYYSFVTMSTLGYGDIAPVASEIRVFAILLSVVGQIYLAVIVALIVGKFLGKIRD